MSDPADLRNAALRALVCLDLTDLDEGSDAQAVDALCRRAQTPQGSVAAVCVWPQFVAQARSALARTGVRVATVMDFPGGESDEAAVLAETEAVLKDGAEEIDLVVPWRRHAAGETGAIEARVRAVKAISGDAPLKAILETGALGDAALIATAAEAALAGGADFLKTSTGKHGQGATPQAAELLLEAISRSRGDAGLKVSGGIRSLEDAAVYLDLCDRIMGGGWAGPRHFRIGASGLIGVLMGALDGDRDADDGA